MSTNPTDDRVESVATDAPANPTVAPTSEPDSEPVKVLTGDEKIEQARDMIRLADSEIAELSDGYRALQERMQELQTIKDKANAIIEEESGKVSHAEQVKRIQRQTQEQLRARHEQNEKLRAVVGNAGGKVFPSQLDAALASGQRRSVVLVNGKPVIAPHPRSPEGIRNYGSWVHGGARVNPNT